MTATLQPMTHAEAISWFEATTPSAAVPGGFREAPAIDVARFAGAPRPDAGLYLIDVREPDEYIGELGHIEGARLAPLAHVTTMVDDVPKDGVVIMICRSGGRSGKAAAAMIQLGYQRVVNMSGGMLAYNAAGLPVVR